MNNITTIQTLLKKTKKLNSSTVALSWHEHQLKQTITFEELRSLVDDYSKGFIAFGLEPGDRVAIFSSNIAMWLILTLSINNAGLIDVPRGENSTEDEINFIIEHSKAKVAITENIDIINKLKCNEHKSLKYIFTIKEEQNIANIKEIAFKGQKSKETLPIVQPSDTASIIYTSGTTGIPKGVELSHGNFMSQLSPILKYIPLDQNDKCLSILPAWHVFERVVKYATLTSGIETYYSTQKTLMDDMLREQPTLLASVPRIWEVIYSRIMRKLKEGSALKKTALKLACSTSISYSKNNKKYSPFKLIQAPFHNLLDKSLYKTLRNRLGGKLRFAISGGSALPNYIDNFFHAAGIKLLEGYGLTETSPVISFRKPNETALFSAGKILESNQAKIIDPETGVELSNQQEGVLYVKGPNVMKGYYRNFEETQKVLFSDGWLNTGDRAFFDANQNLVITGREKDIIVLSNGENINPVPIEKALTKSDYIEYAIVTGQDWKRLSSLIVPNLESLGELCKKLSIIYIESNPENIFRHPSIISFYKKEIKKIISAKNGFKSHEQLFDFRFAKPFSIGKELTLTLKPKRNLIEQLYKVEITSMKKAIHQ
jgi:long-chain acyl-CoA synthetase